MEVEPFSVEAQAVSNSAMAVNRSRREWVTFRTGRAAIAKRLLAG
jgi:hypothetical protein